ncbi:hypothetical protein CPT03_16560 [Pedobacter ginsengisoli]|uniref:Glycoside hydrolase 123 C-terminal domain-containing protein n=1 Tax=Pedobacter ginsengisoli TaxID=363852 RepID=A0A2D1U8M0_9SPHI|nr:hypothetical protein [Pedobacter ginsengisoli]ATP57958.1 hypothetical protein CPT03_16560 [Pedobacter ginsengisoli]
MKKILLLLCSFFFIESSFAQKSNWYYPWNNRLDNLQKVKLNDVIPVLLSGSNYRLLAVNNLKGKRVEGINVLSKFASVKIYYLPLMTDYKNRNILDRMVPVEGSELQPYNKTQYFLVRFYGVKYGNETLKITINTDEDSCILTKEIKVSDIKFQNPLSLNVWAYFDYNFLTKGNKSKIVDDLISHNSNVLVIPPGLFPAVGNISEAGLSKLRGYLKGTNNRFKYYLLYLGYNQNTKSVLTSSWKDSFLKWNKVVSNIFADLNIPAQNVLLYPYDEPKGNSVKTLSELYDWCRSENINNPFFATIGNYDAIPLAKKLEYLQVYSGSMEFVKKINELKKPTTALWLYEIPAGSRNIMASLYQKIGIKAFSLNAMGIGAWNYADVNSAVGSLGLKQFSEGRGSWDISTKIPTSDNTLIYRKGNEIFSSLRWEALSYGMEEYAFLNIYKLNHGENLSNSLVNKLLSGAIDAKEWESIKYQVLIGF